MKHRAMIVALAIFLAACDASPRAPSPEEMARADQIRTATEATATAAALVVRMRIADATAAAPATQTVREANAQATAVVVTARAGSDVAAAQAEPVKDWFSFGALLLVIILFGSVLYWIGRVVRRASMRYGKTATGFIAVDESGQLFNSSTMIESSQTRAVNQADLLFQIDRVWHYFVTGKVLALPEAQKPLLTDGDATAAQRTQGAVTARTGDALAEAMNSKLSERERLERMALVRGRSAKSSDGLLAGFGGPALPAPVDERAGQTNVTVIKPAEDNPYLQLIAGAYGVPVRALAERSQQGNVIDQTTASRASIE